ncbi:hypothetical protein D3C72_2345810 [compost metagenome]
MFRQHDGWRIGEVLGALDFIADAANDLGTPQDKHVPARGDPIALVVAQWRGKKAHAGPDDGGHDHDDHEQQ